MINRIDRWLYFENAADFLAGGGWRGREKMRARSAFKTELLKKNNRNPKASFSSRAAYPERTISCGWEIIALI